MYKSLPYPNYRQNSSVDWILQSLVEANVKKKTHICIKNSGEEDGKTLLSLYSIMYRNSHIIMKRNQWKAIISCSRKGHGIIKLAIYS